MTIILELIPADLQLFSSANLSEKVAEEDGKSLRSEIVEVEFRTAQQELRKQGKRTIVIQSEARRRSVIRRFFTTGVREPLIQTKGLALRISATH